MAHRAVVTMPGDGIGKVVLPCALEVLRAAGFDAEFVHADVGWEVWCREGNPLPERTIQLLGEHRVGLLGAVTSKLKHEAEAELTPELRDKGFVYSNPIGAMRQHFDLDICLRPRRSFPGNPLNYARKGIFEIEEPAIDVAIFSQQREGGHCGVEWTNPPDRLRGALEMHPNMQAFADVPSEDLAVTCCILSRRTTQRVLRAAFEYARRHRYASITVCERPVVVRETRGMMLTEAERIATDYPDIHLFGTNVDTLVTSLMKNPGDFGVIVCGDFLADVVSYLLAGMVGGLGFVCTGNLGEDVAVFEPTHGSAPHYELLDPPIVNPIAMILAACMMLDHLGEDSKANRIRAAVASVIREGKVRTYDMLGLRGGPHVLAEGAASTYEMTRAIIANL